MPELICQICGTPNQPDAVICSMCHSRLGPPPGKTQSLESPSDQPEVGQENLDWLERVRALNAMDQIAKNGGVPPAANAPKPVPTPDPEPAVENPDWLYNTRDLTSAQKPVSEVQAGEDLSWLNDLRASTGSLGPPPEVPTTAAEVLAAAAFAKHQEKLEETEYLGETQQLTPRSSIPGSASDWLDKLGAIGEDDQLKPGFEESFGTSPGNVDPVINYDIERATGSLGKAQDGEAAVPIAPEMQPPIAEPPAEPLARQADESVAEAPASPSAPHPASGLDLTFLDSVLTAPSGGEKASQETEGATLPPNISQFTEQPASIPQPEPSLSWLQDLQSAPESPSVPGSVKSQDIPMPPSAEPPPAAKTSLKSGAIPGEFPPIPANIEELPAQQNEAPAPPMQISQEELDARLLNQFVVSAAESAVPTAAPPPQPPQDLKNLPGFSSTGLTGLLNSDSIAGLEMEGILPPDGAQEPSAAPPQPIPPAAVPASIPPVQGQILPPIQEVSPSPSIQEEPQFVTNLESSVTQQAPPSPSSVADSLFRPPSALIPETPSPLEAAADVEPVDLESIKISKDTPDWLKQYAGELNLDDAQSSLFPSQESLSQEPPAEFGSTQSYPPAEPTLIDQPAQDLPGLQDFTSSESKPVVPIAAEIQNQDWLNTVINETPASPVDLFKDVEEPRFAPREEASPDLAAGDSKPAAWVMEPGQHSGFTGPLPDWLQELEGDQEGKSSSAQVPAVAEEPIPDLFVSAPPEVTVPDLSPTPAQGKPETASSPGIPNLESLGISPGDLFQAAEFSQEAAQIHPASSMGDPGNPPQDLFKSTSSSGGEAEPQPDWLSGLPSMQEQEQLVPSKPAPPSVEKESMSPAAMAGMSVASQVASQKPLSPAAPPSSAVPFGMESLPDWISAESGDGENSDASGDQPALAQAEMPGWLEALKPIGLVKAALAGSQQPPKQSAPATGSLKPTTGSLPGKPVAPSTAQLSPAPPTAAKTETQQQYAAMMEQVLTRGPAPTSKAQNPKKRSKKLLWGLIVGLVLIILLLLAAVGLGFLPLPQLFSAETVSFHGAVEALPAGAPVLVGLEYSPAFVAEMQPISTTIMQQLALKDANVTFISTQAAGPILAEQLLQQTHEEFPTYDLSQKTENLGYLAGGSTGLLGFALHPAIVIRKGWDGQPAWSKPALEGISSLDQFAAVFVLSENADISRDWIEQVQPKLGNAPLLIATSAQTGPLLEPFTASGQVKGLVAGISGAAAYENILGKPSEGSRLWVLYLAGQLLAVLVILLGLVFRVTRDRKNPPGREG